MAESARAKAHISGGEAYPYHGFHVGDGCGFAGTNRHSLEERLLRQIHVNPVVVSRNDDSGAFCFDFYKFDGSVHLCCKQASIRGAVISSL